MNFTVIMELLDSESDGPDTQGIGGTIFNILTDTGLSVPMMSPALTGELGVSGPADVSDFRHYGTNDPEPWFVGGYGFTSPDTPFGGVGDDDDLLYVGHVLYWGWQADTAPNAPGLQPNSLAGVGYGERPAGGDWLFAVGQIPIPSNAGTYTVELVPYSGMFILPEVDLTVDQLGGWRMNFDAGDLIGDAFSFTVLPEPGSRLLLVGAATLLPPRRSQRAV